MGTRLDHLVYGVPDLLDGVRHFAELTGVEPVPGGRHEGRGTANYLIGLGQNAYLEILGPDPEQDQQPGWFGLGALTSPRLLTWAATASDLDSCVTAAREAGYDPGPITPMSRRTPDGDLLSWRLTPDTVETSGGLVPFLIDWGTTTHPTRRGLPELRLRSLDVLSPRPEETSRDLAAIGVHIQAQAAANPQLRCVVETPRGEVTLD